MSLATAIPVDAQGHFAPIGAIADGDVLYRTGTPPEVKGITQAALAALLSAVTDVVTAAPNATYSWNTTATHVAVTHAAAACDVTLPSEAQVTNWPVGAPPRRLSKMNTSANGINLRAPSTVTINGGAADADMSPIPDSDGDPSNSVLAQSVWVYRASATAFWVWGAA